MRSASDSEALLLSQHRGRSAVASPDLELADFLAAVHGRLAAMEHLRGPDWDVAYAQVEAFAAPYALALYHEVLRLNPAAVQEAQQGEEDPITT